MTPKEWLSRGWRIDREIKELEQSKEEILTCITKTTSNPENERVDGSGGNSNERALVVYIDKANKCAALIQERINSLVSVKSEIIGAIQKVNDSTLRALLTARYINFKTWEQIAVELNYSYMHVCRLHGKALVKIKDVIECYTL